MKLFRGLSVAVAVLAMSALAFAGETQVAQGKVKAVTDKAVTLAVDNGGELTFDVSQGARVYGQGASHKSRMLVSSGRPTTMGDFVREGNYVTVYYREQAGTRAITQLRVH
jgi:hypothetical protein